MTSNYSPKASLSDYLKISECSLLKYYMNMFSECGQDGILNEIFNRIGIRKGLFCEFGAWDGYHLSNSRRLNILGWKGIFIEGDVEKFKILKELDPPGLNVLINDFVVPDANSVQGNTLDFILEKNNVVVDEIDFLSIDIDGLDLEVFESIKFRPKVVLLEGGFNYNPRLSAPLPLNYSANNNQQPLQYVRDSVRRMGYDIVCFFQDSYLVRNDFLHKFEECVKLTAEDFYKDAWFFANNNLREMIVNLRKNDPVLQAHEISLLNAFNINPVAL